MNIAHALRWLTDNIGFVTLIVGGFAIFLYIKQRRDNKRDAASLILQEVRFAESQIRHYRSAKSYPLSSTILPSSSWHKNINLFVKDLSESEIDLISTFYSQAAYIDILINTISKVASEKVETESFSIPQLPDVLPTQPFAGMVLQPAVQVRSGGLGAHKILDQVSERIEFIFNSPAIDKLARLSKRKWYLLWL